MLQAHQSQKDHSAIVNTPSGYNSFVFWVWGEVWEHILGAGKDTNRLEAATSVVLQVVKVELNCTGDEESRISGRAVS